MPPLSEPSLSTARRAGIGAAALAALAWCLVVVGALVRAHGAGLSCPDWPLCHGQAVPEFDFRIAFEWGHRAMAGSLSLGLVALAAFIVRSRELRARFGVSLAWVFSVLGVQVTLGGLTVLLGLAPWTVTAHLLTGNAFVVSLFWLSRSLLESSSRVPLRRARAPRGAAPIAAACALLLVVQLALGGLVSSHYAGLACTTFPLCNADSLAPALSGQVGLHVIHRLNAYVVCAALAALAWSVRGSTRLSALSRTALGLVLVQVAVGVANVLWRLPVEVTALHSALAPAIALCIALSVREILAARAGARERVPPSGSDEHALEGAR